MTEMFIGWRTTPKMGSAPPHSPTARSLGTECSSSALQLSLGLVTLPSLVLQLPSPLQCPLSPHSPAGTRQWDPGWILTFSPLGPESPFRPGKPGGPLGTQRENKRGNKFVSHSFIPFKTPWNWLLWTYHWAWRTIRARRSRETLFTL